MMWKRTVPASGGFRKRCVLGNGSLAATSASMVSDCGANEGMTATLRQRIRTSGAQGRDPTTSQSAFLTLAGPPPSANARHLLRPAHTSTGPRRRTTSQQTASKRTRPARRASTRGCLPPCGSEHRSATNADRCSPQRALSERTARTRGSCTTQEACRGARPRQARPVARAGRSRAAAPPHTDAPTPRRGTLRRPRRRRSACNGGRRTPRAPARAGSAALLDNAARAPQQ
mmetsp:Transcript_70220/g.194353  ORF Transcript_70220/g.194353 Transcript_70220/m.194353 type:complete len:230 (+) Transcript_70220:157-846(+)